MEVSPGGRMACGIPTTPAIPLTLLMRLKVGPVMFGNMLAVRLSPGESSCQLLLAMGGVIGLTLGENSLVM